MTMNEGTEIANLDDILPQDQDATTEAESQNDDVPQEQPAQQGNAASAVTQGDQSDTGEHKDAPPASEDQTNSKSDQQFKTPQENAMYEKAKDELRKRQELETRLESLEQQLQQQQAPQEEDESDWVHEPEQAQAQMERKIDQSLFDGRVAMSQEIMRSLHADYDKVETFFVDEAKKNPALGQQLRSHPNPAKYAYEQGKALQFQEQVGTDPEKYKATLREELKAEVEAEHQAKQKQVNKDAVDAQKPNSLAGAPNAALRDGPKWSGPTPLGDIIN